MGLKLASLFSDHVVLQRGRALPVWGRSAPGEDVELRFLPGAGSGDRELTATARAGADGKWTAELGPLNACVAPARLIVRSLKGGAEREVRDVLVGEVWVASGQSNMQWEVKLSADAPTEIASADWPAIRMFTAPRIIRDAQPEDVEARWMVSSPKTAGEFSAVAFFFARELHRREGVPVGIVNSSWGGTRVEAWTCREALLADPLCRREVETYEADLRSGKYRNALEEYRADPAGWMRRHVAQDPGNEGLGRGWAGLDFDDSGWPEMDLPRPWQRGGVDGNGVVWFRREVEVPAAMAGHDLDLRIGACDKHDVAYFNGEQVGSTGWEAEAPWTVLRGYRVPGRLVRPGRNVVAVRVYSYRNAGGLVGPEAEMRLSAAAPAGAGSPALSLAGPWRYRVEHDFGPIRGAAAEPPVLPNQNSPYALWENMIAPLVPFAARGFIWYQGESNTGNPHQYLARFTTMIRQWRRAWRSDEMPFLFVQLANFAQPGQTPQDGWPRLREAQLQALREPLTGMAVAIDIGDANDIHPRNKQEVGRRLALAAERVAYGRDLVFSGPILSGHSVEGSAVRLRFDHAGGGLVFDGSRGRGFAVAGDDRRFVAAEAVIQGDEIVVRSAEVARPVAVRYAWADDPERSLRNREGLPASPFRTDAW